MIPTESKLSRPSVLIGFCLFCILCSIRLVGYAAKAKEDRCCGSLNPTYTLFLNSLQFLVRTSTDAFAYDELVKSKEGIDNT